MVGSAAGRRVTEARIAGAYRHSPPLTSLRRHEMRPLSGVRRSLRSRTLRGEQSRRRPRARSDTAIAGARRLVQRLTALLQPYVPLRGLCPQPKVESPKWLARILRATRPSTDFVTQISSKALLVDGDASLVARSRPPPQPGVRPHGHARAATAVDPLRRSCRRRQLPRPGLRPPACLPPAQSRM